MPVKKSIASTAPAKPAVKKPAAKKPAAKAQAASIQVPPKVAAAAKPAAKKPAVKRKPVSDVPAALREIYESFKKGGVTRSISLGGKITKAQKEVLDRVAKKHGVTPSELVAALVINFLSVCE